MQTAPQAGEPTAEPTNDHEGVQIRFDTIGSTVVVTNGPTQLWTNESAWTAQEIFRIGAAHAPAEETFGAMIRATLGPDGYTYVLDPQAADMKVFDGSGQFVRAFGGKGEGPGELAAPTAMAWDGHGRLWLANAFNRRYTLYDSLGQFVKTVPRPVRGISSRHQFIIDRADSFIDVGSGSVMLRIDTMGAVVDTLGRIEFPKRYFARAPLPPGFDSDAFQYLPRLYWTLTGEGSIWSVDSHRLRLVKTTAAGDTLRIVHTAHRDEVDLDAGARLEVEHELAKLTATADYEIVRPIIGGIEALPGGHVIVQILREVGEASDLHDVFDPEGRYLGSLKLGVTLAPGGVSSFVGDTVIAVTHGQLDVPYVVRIHLNR